MSEMPTTDMPENGLTSTFNRWKGIGLIVFVLGLVGVGAGFASGPKVMLQGYLFAWVFWTFITLGCFGFMTMHHALRSNWSLSIIRMLEAGGGVEALFLSFLGYIPIMMNLKEVYPWADPANVVGNRTMEFKMWYLNTAGFTTRYIAYFAIFMLVAWLLRKSSRQHDLTLDPRLGALRMSVGAVGMVIYFVVGTFAVTDWVMSLEKYWYSSMLALMNMVGAGLGALGICTWLLLVNRDKSPYKEIMRPSLTKDLGNMCFATTMTWQYLMLSQYLITYAANLSEEVPYYLKRNLWGWEYLVTFVVLFQFFVPWTMLLSPRVKRYAKSTAAVAGLIFFVRIADIYWTVIPSMRSDIHQEKAMSLVASASHWQDWAAFALFMGGWFFVLGAQMLKAYPIPMHDDRLLEVAHAH